ncbi:regulator, partial [Kitasatospora sp. A2-31]|nr:regulator [Kitasatospora sp. A2-31]
MGQDSRIENEPEAARAIVRLCGCLPLALRIVAALLSRDSLKPLSGLVTDLSDRDTVLDELSVAELAVRTAFFLSLCSMTDQAAHMFRMLALSPGADISTDAAVALSGHTKTVSRRLLDDLADAHLIERGTVHGRWRFHDLMRVFATEEVDARCDAILREAAIDRLLGYYLETARWAESESRDRIPEAEYRAYAWYMDERD